MDNQIQVNTVKPELSFFENEQLNRLLNFDGELSLDSKIEAVETFMKSNTGAGLTDLEKDALYADCQKVYVEYKKALRDVKFNLCLNRSQYNFLTDLILKKLEYDVNTVFIAIELTKLLGTMEGTKYSNDAEIKVFEVDATELTYIYHLIQPYKVKGLTKEAYTFSKLLVRIGELSKVINYYDAYGKSLTEDIQKWALSLDGQIDEIVQGQPLPHVEEVTQ
jgi:hypothetical protein